MINTRVWPVRAMYMLVAAALVISLMITAAPAQSVSAQNGMVYAEWDRVDTPTMEDWVLAPGSEIIDYAVPDGGETAYAIVTTDFHCEDGKGESLPVADEEYVDVQDNGDYSYLLKSTDHAATWKDITKAIIKEIARAEKVEEEDAEGDLWKVATDPLDPDFVAVVLEVYVWEEVGVLDWESHGVHVFISNNGGTSFRDTGEVGEELDRDHVLVFAVAPEVKGMRNIAIGGTDGMESMLFRCLAIGDIGTGWTDATAYDGWDDEGLPTAFDSAAVVDFQFAPSWEADNTVLAATVTDWGTNQSAVHLQSGTWGTVEAWNAEAGFEDAVPIVENVYIPSFLQQWTAGINTPSDYTRHTTKRYAWVNVNWWDGVNKKTVGTIFRVINASVNAIDTQVAGEPWLSKVSYLGTIASGKAIASLFGKGTFSGEEPPGCGADLKAGCCEGVDVHSNHDIADMEICCLAWKPSCKPPTGKTAMDVMYVTPDKAYAVALWGSWWCDEGAWSWTFDDGETWNQLSLIDTRIDYLSDVAVSPNCNKTMLVSINYGSYCGCDSVWYKATTPTYGPEYSGQWMRTWCGRLEGYDYWDYEHGLLRLAPEEVNGETVYLVDYGTDTIYWNEVQTLGCWEMGSATVDNIVDLAVKDKDNIYALDASGSVAMSTGHGETPTWTEPVESKVDEGHTIAVWGDHVLVGGKDGEVSYSNDGGETFTEITEPQDAKLPSGWVTVAFDSYFDANGVIYAALYIDDPDYSGGIYRWVMDDSTEWYNLRAEPTYWQATYEGDPYDTETYKVAYTGLVLDNADGNPMTSAATGGVLYASYVGVVDGYWVTGVARQLTPALDFCCDETDWDFLHVGLTQEEECCFWECFDAMPDALKICGCLTPDTNSHLFAIDYCDYYDMCKGQLGAVWTFEDCYAKHSPDLISPPDGTIVPDDGCCEILPFVMEWSRLCDACNYQIEIALDSEFTQGVLRFPEQAWWWLEEEAAIRPVPAMSPSWMFYYTEVLKPGTTYYWRIRALEAETGQVIRSWWSSPALSFTTSLLSGSGVNLLAPEQGTTGVPRTSIAFQWSAVAEADSYEWVLSPNADLSSPVDSQTVTSTGHTFTGNLAYDTPYYWSVTSLKDGAATSMAMATFHTAATPQFCSPTSGLCFDTEEELRQHQEELQKPITPVWVWVVIAIGAVLVIVVIVLIFRTRRV